MTSMKDVAPAIGPAAVRILNALTVSASLADRWPDMNNPQHRYARAAGLTHASAWHTLVCAKLFPSWASEFGASIDAWTLAIGQGPGEEHWKAIAGMPWPTQAPHENPLAFASRIQAIANDIGQAFGVDPPGAWNPDLVNVDPPPEWIVDTYNGVMDVCSVLPIIGWITEALLWVVGGIASLFVSYADSVFGAEPTPLTAELIASTTEQMAAGRVSLVSIVEQARGLGWSDGLRLQRTTTALTSTAAAKKAATTRKTVAVVLGTGAALALVWLLMA